MNWLTVVPVRVVRSLTASMVRLQAEESTLAQVRIAMGAGTLEKSDARRIANDWRRQAEGPKARTKAVKPTRENLAALGIGVLVAPAKGTH